MRKAGLIKLNARLAESLGLSVDEMKSEEALQAFAGNGVFPGSEPLAMAYAGQQFGHWNPQLGDGRALLLGEVLSPDGLRYDIQLKGSGPTPFSRMGDGRAWLGPVLREYIVSEAMAALGISTTRALAAVTTGEDVIRESVLPGAIITRVARSHLRVGTFQYFAARRDEEALHLLADYAIDRLYPHARNADNPYVALLEAVVEAQAKLVASWMNLGFIHGVMNTDNVAISGETIDYGPCAFMDEYHPDQVFSSIDEMGRYAYANQPRIAHWNLVQFAQSIVTLLGPDEESAVAAAQSAIDIFPAIYADAHRSGFNSKLGLGSDQDVEGELSTELLKIMADTKSDFTQTFTLLTTEPDRLGDAFHSWLGKWRKLGPNRAIMQKSNPFFIPRNHLVEQVIRAGLDGDFAPFHRLVDVLEKPYEEQPDNADLMAPPEPSQIVRATFCGT